MRFSIRFLLLLVISVALLLSVYLHYTKNDNSLDPRREAEIWLQKLRTDRTESISLELRGHRFAIANSEAHKIGDNRWVLGMSEILQGELFAYPPGKRVKDIDEAFKVFDEYLKENRSQNKR